MKFFVFNHKIIVGATPSIFPVTIEKMYEPEDTPPVINDQSTCCYSVSAQRHSHAQLFVSDGTGSGIQSFTPLMDNAITVGNHSLQSGQAINFSLR